MVQQTPRLALPYVEGTDTPVTYPATSQDLATKLDAAVTDRHGDTMSGNLAIQSVSPQLLLDTTSATPQSRGIQMLQQTKARWRIRANTSSETGSNAGSNLLVEAFSDAGDAVVAVALNIARATGLVTLVGDPVVALGAATKQYVDNRFKAGALLFGSAGTGPPTVQSGSVALALTGGVATLTFPQAFTSGVLSLQFTNGDTANGQISIGGAIPTLTNVAVKVWDLSAAAQATGTKRINYVAVGW